MKRFYLDERIRDRFQLFKGLRSEEEDQEIHKTVYEACFLEILAFLKDHLEEFTFSQLQAELKAIKDEANKPLISTYSIIIKYLNQVSEGAYKLDRRLDHLVNNLLIQSMKQLST